MTPQKILYVDDEPMNLEVFRLSFKSVYEVVIANSARKALKILEELPDIELVISDMKMPIINGIEFIEMAKEQSPMEGRLYFILTGFDINEEITRALNRGLIDAYFQKPFNKSKLKTALEELSELREEDSKASPEPSASS